MVRLSIRPLRTGLLATVLLAATLAGAEWAARCDAVRSRLPAPGVGSMHRQFEVQLARLDTLAREGPVDCLLVGSSALHWGVDPAVVRAVYRERTGGDVRCFGFGVLGMTGETASRMAQILVRRYHPVLLVEVDTPLPARDASRATGAIESSPWVQYQAGAFSLDGWLTEHSAAYRDYLAQRNWMRTDYWTTVAEGRALEAGTTAYGYAPAPAIATRVALRTRISRSPACPDAWSYPLAEPSAATLDRLAAIAADGVRVTVLEMPVPSETFLHCPAKKQEYRAHLAATARAVQARGLDWWPPPSPALVPDRGWIDPVHLNATGADALSRWLGAQMAAADGRGTLLAREEP